MVSYEWKPPHCLSCGVFGHIDKACSQKPCGAEEKLEGDGVQPRNSSSSSESKPNPDDGGGSMAAPRESLGPCVVPDEEYDQAWKQHDWSKARAKKKRPERSSGLAATRVESCRLTGVVPAPVVLSNSHWRADAQSENLVAQPAPFPIKVTNSKSSPPSLGVDCPPNQFDCLSPELDQPLCPDETLFSNRKDDLNPKATESSAGHTPFLNRGPLAGKNRLDQLKKFGPPKPKPWICLLGPMWGPFLRILVLPSLDPYRFPAV
ncbi:hypothetical protein NE237_014302 [Protea cynaroides]|uniref:Uncharacterized protein n=1 Tax=Protea cynaroides TaxID=273540 RepID=A0A9Q0GKS4_9MAGN|nr:hypothetical protein NE237_014302 [Protea cynaroides]